MKFDKLIEIGDEEYNVAFAETEEEKEKGLQGVKRLKSNQGMLFIYEEPQEEVSFWMKDTSLSLDIIYIDKNNTVISVYEGVPFDETPLVEKDVKYVLELKSGSDVEPGDTLEILDNTTMKVLNQDGSTQYEFDSGSRIFSIKHTTTLIKMAKRAAKTQLDSDFKKLGKKIFKYIDIQDNQDLEYVHKD